MRYAVYPVPILGPCPCHDCGEPLFWARRNTRANGETLVNALLGWRGFHGRLHECPKSRSKAA